MYETAPVVVLIFLLVPTSLSPIVRIACRTKYARHHGDDGDDDARRGILRAFSCCKVYFILNLMQK